MSCLIYIESSPRKDRSSSIAVAQTFLEHYQQTHPSDQIRTIDLWEKELPRFDGDVIDSKYAILSGQVQTQVQREAWQKVEDVIDEFKSGDKYVISVPMWNFSIPYVLKHYLDVIIQPSYTFSYSSEGYKGLVADKPVVVIYSRGGSYGPGSGAEIMDHQKTYMETVLRFIGFTDIRSIFVEPTATVPDQKETMMTKVIEEAKEMAKSF